MTPAAMLCDEKRLTTAQARAALIGATLNPATAIDGTELLVLTRWGQTRELHSIEAAEALLDRMGAPAGSMNGGR